MLYLCLYNKTIKMEQVIQFLKDKIKGTVFENNTFICGGFVRDKVMNISSKDIDLMVDVPNGSIEFVEYFTTNFPDVCNNKASFPRFGVAKMDVMNEQVEVVVPRLEQYSEESRKPTDIQQCTLLEDVKRRDFTINTLLINLSTDEVLDLTKKGIEDIKNGIIRCTDEPTKIFFDDPLRILRAVRQAIKFGFDIEEKTLNGIKENSYRLTGNNKYNSPISIERINDELTKMLLLYKPSQCIKMLCELGLMQYIIPEVDQLIGLIQNKHHKWDVFGHTMNVLDNVEPILELRLAALLHDIGKIKTKTITETGVHFYKHELASEVMADDILRKLKYSNDVIKTVKFLVKEHMRTKQFGNDCSKVKDKTIRKFVDQVGKYRDLLLQLTNADNISHSDESNMPDQVYNIQLKIDELGLTNIYKIELPINGNDIMEEYNLEPSSKIKDCLNHIRKLCYINPVLTKVEALKHCKSFLNNK